MIRNLKALGLALVALFALSALAASAASAEVEQGELTAEEPVTLTGTDTGEETNFLRVPGLGTTECTHSTYTGHKFTEPNETTHEQQTGLKPHNELIPVGATTATVTPHYDTHCIAHLGILGTRPATVTMNGCDYVFHIGKTTPAENKEGTYGVTADLVCPENKFAEVHIYKASSTEHLAGDSICTFKFSGEHEGKAVNQGLKGAHLTHTEGKGDFDLEGIFTDIHYTREGSLCGSGTGVNAELGVDITIEGHNEVPEPIDVTITDQRP